jgi:large subunit ribosomal protein L30
MAWVVVRVRGGIHARHDIVETLRFLHLTRPNHATVLPEAASFRGMIHAVQGYVTWGEAEPETLDLLLRERGETIDGARITDATAAGVLHAKDVPEVVHAVAEQGLTKVPGLRPTFRLKAPKGGWRSTKKPYSLGGALGYRGRSVNDLVRRMI